MTARRSATLIVANNIRGDLTCRLVVPKGVRFTLVVAFIQHPLSYRRLAWSSWRFCRYQNDTGVSTCRATD